MPGSISLWEEYQKWRESDEGQSVRRNRGLIGSPETLRTRLRKFEESHVDQVILINQAGKNSHDDITRSLDLFAREVMPEFQGRDGEHQEWKKAVLAGEIELERIDPSDLTPVSLQSPDWRERATE